MVILGVFGEVLEFFVEVMVVVRRILVRDIGGFLWVVV